MRMITGEDYRIVKQTVLDIRIRFEIYDRKENYIGSIDGNVINGSCTIDAESDIRRSFSITIFPDHKSKTLIDEQGYIWIDKYVHIYIGIIDMQTGEPVEWKFGVFLFTNVNTTYDPVTNQMSINCSDLMSVLDGSKNGELGQLNIIYPAYEEDEQGHPTHYNTIRNAVIDTISQLGRINNYNIDDIGEYNAMPLYNKDYLQYRYETSVRFDDGRWQELWNTIPFDQEFSAGCTVLNILTTFRDLYPNYEAYFDPDGVFCMNMIPSGEEDPVIIHNDFFQDIYISENTSVDLTTVRNVCHVWGQVLDTDFFSDTSEYEDNVYKVTYEGYTDEENTNYKNGDRIAFKVTSTGESNVYNANNASYSNNTYWIYIDDYPEELDLMKQINFIAQSDNEGTETYININGNYVIPLYENHSEDFVGQKTIFKGNILTVSIQLVNDQYIAYNIIREDNIDTLYVKVNDLDPIPIFDENTEKPIDRKLLEVDNTYVFKIKSKRSGDDDGSFRAYFLGSWQAHGITALVNNTKGEDMLYVNTALKIGEEVSPGYFCLEDGEFYAERSVDPETGKYIYDGKYAKSLSRAYYQEDINTYYRVVRRYSQEYFEEVYSCPSVRLKVIPNSPYTCQKIGEYMDVLTDDKNITSSSLAVSRADWEVYKQARLTDSISLVTTLCPFADVNIKVEYHRHDLPINTIYQYIVKNVSHDFSGGTTTWQLMRFYPLYERNRNTHDMLKHSEYTHYLLSKYEFEEI